MATLGDRCRTLPDLLYFADKGLTKARQTKKDLVSDQDISDPSPDDMQKYLNRSVDLKPTRQLVGQLISAGIFTYPAFLGFLEHEFYRNARKNRDLLVLLIKVRIRSEKFDEATHLLPDQAFYEVIRRVGAVITKRDVFAHYSHGNFVIMRSNASVTEMQNLSKRIVQSVTANQWITPECPVDSLRIRVQISAVRVHETSSTLFGFVPIE
jgi:GGDEF domain-containing protein